MQQNNKLPSISAIGCSLKKGATSKTRIEISVTRQATQNTLTPKLSGKTNMTRKVFNVRVCLQKSTKAEACIDVNAKTGASQSHERRHAQRLAGLI
jgi:hypothetical protein